MDRRVFVIAALASLAAPLGVEAQQRPARKLPRIGFMSIGTVPTQAALWDPLIEGLRELGYVEGRTIVIERQFGGGRRERARELGANLARAPLDMVVCTGTQEAETVRELMASTPVVFVIVPDPVGYGLVQSLARPGGNLTGFATQTAELTGKRLQFAREALPRAGRVVLFMNSTAPTRFRDSYRRELLAAASKLKMQSRVIDVANEDGVTGAFASLATERERPDFVVVPLDAMFFASRNRITTLAAKHRQPVFYEARFFVDAGGLISYGPKIPALFRRAAVFVDKILKGAKPADLPVEQPTEFELVINLKTAKTLGLTIPPSLLLQANEVIQ
ncbi:MAG: ABC transporter substrate-binding protein [Betaproteobacteria bacterium]